MNKCQFCGEDRNNIKHHLLYFVPVFSDSNKIIKIREFWKCTVKGEIYEGKLSEKSSEKAKKNYQTRKKLFICNLNIQIDQEDSGAYRNRGICYLELENFKQAVGDFSQAIKFNHNDVEAYLLRGKAYVKLGKTDLAVKDFQIAARDGNKEAQEYLNMHELKY